MNIREYTHIENVLEKQLPVHRMLHSRGVAHLSAALAMRHRALIEDAMVAGILHDCAKMYSDEELLWLCESHGMEISASERQSPFLLHAKYGAYLAENFFGVTKADVLEAIRYHTTGCAEMTLLSKIVYVADYIEPTRTQLCEPPLSVLRALAFENIDACVAAIAKSTIAYLKKSGREIDPMTQETLNYYERMK